MVILETSVFTRQITSLLSDEEYRNIQNELVTNPTLGPKEPGRVVSEKYELPLRDTVNEEAHESFTSGHRTESRY
jgi:hypothetical protein